MAMQTKSFAQTCQLDQVYHICLLMAAAAAAPAASLVRRT